MTRRFDVIVLGGGHAGCEAAAAACRMGATTALVTHSIATIGAMSCNPSIGGVGKGHLVREVDALDGLMARAADAAAIHYRMLNRSKGSAVRGPRVQADRTSYRHAMRKLLESEDRLSIVTGHVKGLALRGRAVAGVTLEDGTVIESCATVIATGTFLGARMFRGLETIEGGRVGERAGVELAAQFAQLDLPMGRMKTGTPPRIDGRSIDWSKLAVQPSDHQPWTMSPLGQRALPQVHCAITHTNSMTHDRVRASLESSPLLSGAISGRGPRYCPSIEDKITRFADRNSHQIFLEPEGHDTNVIYPNGISTSLATGAQDEFVRTIAGLESARIVAPGYAVEYGHIDPRALDHTLRLRALDGVFCAGQINGTTGYEEAAAQGLVAGANAAASALGRDAFRLERENSYIGVMIDDLVLQGVSEPYRMLTARAEFRLRLRADNAATRLTALGISSGVVGLLRAGWWHEHANQCARARAGLPTTATAQEEVVADLYYAPYVARQQREIEKRRASRTVLIATDFDFSEVAGLSTEMIERFSEVRPGSLDEAERVAGVTPAALSALFLGLQRLHAA